MGRRLEHRFPDAVFLGPKLGNELASIYAGADVFVFPSLTDTFGLVTLEALACGTPVAALPSAGPLEVLTASRSSTVNHHLGWAIERCLTLKRSDCRAFAVSQSWERCVDIFAESMIPIPPFADRRASEIPLEKMQAAPNSRYHAYAGL